MPEQHEQTATASTWVFATEAAQILGLSYDTLIRLTDAGAIPCWRPMANSQRRWSRAVLAEYLASAGQPAAVADAGFAALDATFPAAALLAIVIAAAALPGGTAAALAALVVVVGVVAAQVRHAHRRGLARVAAAERRESAIAVRRIYAADRAPAVVDVRVDPRMTDAVAARLLTDITRGGAR